MNPHGLPHTPLKRARLPIPPLPHEGFARGIVAPRETVVKRCRVLLTMPSSKSARVVKVEPQTPARHAVSRLSGGPAACWTNSSGGSVTLKAPGWRLQRDGGRLRRSGAGGDAEGRSGQPLATPRRRAGCVSGTAALHRRGWDAPLAGGRHPPGTAPRSSPLREAAGKIHRSSLLQGCRVCARLRLSSPDPSSKRIPFGSSEFLPGRCKTPGTVSALPSATRPPTTAFCWTPCGSGRATPLPADLRVGREGQTIEQATLRRQPFL